MGLFGKSKSEKEREESEARRRAENAAYWAAQADAEYEKLLDVLTRIKKRQPRWSIKQLARAAEYTSGLACHVEFISDDGFVTHLSAGSHSRHPPVYWCTLGIYYQPPSGGRSKGIYQETFYSSSTYGGPGKRNVRAWKYLDDYLRTILDTYIRRASEERHNRENQIEDMFWKS